MDFYQHISRYYEQIFPLQKAKEQFVLSFVDPDDTYLDIGCGTGELVHKMAEVVKVSIGIDLSEEMIREAQEKDIPQCHFWEADMQYLSKHFEPTSLGVISCLGNTLVHLADLEEIQEALEVFYELLLPGGTLLIQIVNYDLVLSYQEKELPLLENEKMKFERHYKNITERKVKFETTLTDKATGESYQQNVDLFPLTSLQLNDILFSLGFTEIKFYDDFEKSPWTANKMGMVVSAKKKN